MPSPTGRRIAPPLPPALGLAQALALLGAAPGCGGRSGRMAVHPVLGTVRLAGRPAAGADIVLHPAAPLADKDADYLRGAVGDDGSFAIGTYGDGAPSGVYRVSIFRGGGSEDEGLQVARAKGPGLFQKYRNPDRSGLSVTVKEGSNHLEPFRLTSGAR